MKAHEIRSKVQANARACEATLQALEEKCTSAKAERERLATHLEGKLIEIADFAIANNQPIGNEAARQLELRTHEEQSMREQLQRVEADITERLAAVQKLDSEREACERAAATMLSQNDLFQQRLVEHKEAQTLLKRQQHELEEIQSECSRKLPAFKANRLYSYLNSVHYDTADYNASGLFRVADAWIARLCNFRQNKIAESVLRTMQLESAKRIEGGRARLDEHQLWLTNQQNAATVASGSAEVFKNMEAQRTLIAQQQARIPGMKQALTEYAERRDSRYTRARDLVVSELSRYEGTALASKPRLQALALPESDIRTITALRMELSRHDQSHAALYQQRQQADAANTRAQVIQRELRRDKYVSERCTYRSGLNFDSLLAGYMLGQYDSHQVTQSVVSHQVAVEPATAPTWSTPPSDVTPRTGGSYSGSSYPGSSRDDDDRHSRSSSSRSASGSFSDDGSRSSSYSSSSDSGGGGFSSSDSF